MRISHYWPRHGGNVMALVLHRCGEMGKNAMSLLLRLALHSGEDRHGDFLGSFFFFFRCFFDHGCYVACKFRICSGLVWI